MHLKGREDIDQQEAECKDSGRLESRKEKVAMKESSLQKPEIEREEKHQRRRFVV